jgi:hypothetical protein
MADTSGGAYPPPSSYLPPPPPVRSRRSPWLWVALGCGLLALLLLGGVVGVGYLFVRNTQRELQKAQNEPLSEAQVRAAIGDTPLYPGARPDIATSKQMRGIVRAAGGITGVVSGGKIKTAAAAFLVPATPNKVLAWYTREMEGWELADDQQRIRAGGEDNAARGFRQSRAYRRGDRQIQITVGGDSEAAKTSSLTFLIFEGLPAGR